MDLGDDDRRFQSNSWTAPFLKLPPGATSSNAVSSVRKFERSARDEHFASKMRRNISLPAVARKTNSFRCSQYVRVVFCNRPVYLKILEGVSNDLLS